MGKITGFLEYRRESCPSGGPVAERLQRLARVRRARSRRRSCRRRARAAWTAACRSATTAARSGNIIPDWNDLVYRGRWQRGASTACTRPTTSRSSPGASARRRARRPACSASTTTPVTIKQIEKTIIERALRRGLDRARAARAAHRQARGGGRLRAGRPGGGAAAEPRRAHGHGVRAADRIGGLLRYGIPDFKLEKRT